MLSLIMLLVHETAQEALDIIPSLFLHYTGRIRKRSFNSIAVRPTVHTNPSPKRSFLRTISNRRNLKTPHP